MDHSKFDDLEKGLTGKAIVDKLTEDFEILQKFLIIRRGLPKISYEAYMELEVSIREMMEYDTPSVEQWKSIERFEKTKYILHSRRQELRAKELLGRRHVIKLILT